MKEPAMKQEIQSDAAGTSLSQPPSAASNADSKVQPHATSMAVWDVPFQIVLGTPFNIKVGVKCADECKLIGSVVEIYDHTSKRVATRSLREAPWQAVNTLYWTEVELQAPPAEGPFTWTAKVSDFKSEAAHSEALHSFALRTVQAPEHTVTVRVTDKLNNTPIKKAQVILHPFTGLTDENGVAKIGVTVGEYNLWIPKIAKFDTFRTTVKVDADIVVQAELVIAPLPER